MNRVRLSPAPVCYRGSYRLFMQNHLRQYGVNIHEGGFFKTKGKGGPAMLILLCIIVLPLVILAELLKMQK